MNNVTVTAAVKIANAGNRSFINIYNNGGGNLFVCYDGSCDSTAGTNPLTTANGWPIPSGGQLYLSNDSLRNNWRHEIWAVSDGSSDVRIQEGA